ncbi:hypothetical protein ACR3G9_004047 [Salmonella enterica]|nr:hypothetical protein [Salmonella enterica]
MKKVEDIYAMRNFEFLVITFAQMAAITRQLQPLILRQLSQRDQTR